MQTAGTPVQWLRHWLYDWGGANTELFLAIHGALPESWVWLANVLSGVGSYWGAPLVVALLLAYRSQDERNLQAARLALCTFVIAVVFAMSAGTLAKLALEFPRPSAVLGESVYRAASAPDNPYTLPSGHSIYAGVLAAALAQMFGPLGKASLGLLAVAVGWSRIALGAHFPADVVAGLALGWACTVAAGPLARKIAPRLREVCARP